MWDPRSPKIIMKSKLFSSYSSNLKVLGCFLTNIVLRVCNSERSFLQYSFHKIYFEPKANYGGQEMIIQFLVLNVTNNLSRILCRKSWRFYLRIQLYLQTKLWLVLTINLSLKRPVYIIKTVDSSGLLRISCKKCYRKTPLLTQIWKQIFLTKQ